MVKRIAVIGAGASGLPSIKACVDDGLQPVCFERTDDIGGLWNFRETCDGQACVMKSTIINTSKEMMCYSDFPIPQEFPNFMHNTKVIEYFRLYAEKFNLLKYIRFKTDVLKVRPAKDFNETGKWDIEIKDLTTGVVTTETYDGVLVCTGHHAEKHMPQFEGDEQFEGRRIHSHDYRDFKGFEDKRVVVIGIGNSGGDAAVELSKVSKQVFLSTRRGTWVTHRIGDNGLPVDYLFIRHCVFDLYGLLPKSLINAVVERKMNQRFDHKLYGLEPKHRFDAQHAMVNDELPNRIASGGVKIKPNVRRITKTGVEFEDGSFENDIDIILYATGYKFGFPFIEHKALEVKKNQVNLFKYVFPPSVQPASLAVIGCIQPLGSIMPISELQARLAVKVFTGERKLPSVEDMWKDVHKKKTEMSERYFETQRHTVQVDYVPFMDELAELTGCKPDFVQLFKKDPRLAWHLYFGASTPYQYRLVGANKWSGAREAILTTWDRVAYPFQTQKNNRGSSRLTARNLFIAVVVIVFLAIFLRWYLDL